MNQSRRRRRVRQRGVYISPVGILLAAVVAVLALLLIYQVAREADMLPLPPAEADGASGAPPAPAAPAERATTPSGIPCRLTELEEEAIHTGELALVNNWTHYHFPEDQEAGLVCILEERSDSFFVRDGTVYLEPAAMDALNAMMDDFVAQGGSRTINVIAGYRTKDFQQHLFDQSVERNGLEHAQRYVAQPGGSEHHTGLVVDLHILKDGVSIEYDGTGEYAWINENCHNYGYIVRYETGKEHLTGIWDEPWHFRYVGIPHAAEIAARELCLEEYIDLLKEYPFDGEHLTIQCAGGVYEVWYTEGTQVYLPEEGAYSLSGNNVDGFIVTVKVGS